MNRVFCAVVAIALCLLAAPSAFALDAARPAPVFLWSRTLEPYVEVPPFNNILESAQAQRVVEFRQNLSHASGYLRGINATNGYSEWTFVSPCQYVKFIENLNDGTNFMIGCLTAVYIHALVDGSLVAQIPLPIGTTFAPMAQPPTSNGYRRFIALIPRRYIIVSLANTTQPQTIVYGSMVISMTTWTFTEMPGMLNCPSNPVANIHTEMGEQGYTQVCLTYQVMYVPFKWNSTLPTWQFHNHAYTSFMSAAFAAGSSLANVAAVYSIGSQLSPQGMAAWNVVTTNGQPMWTLSIPASIGTVAAIAAYGENIIAVGSTGAMAANNGNVLWTRTDLINLLPVIVSDSVLGALVLMTTGSLYNIDVTTGTTIQVTTLDNVVSLPVYTFSAPVRHSQVPYDSNVPALSASKLMLIISSGNYIQTADVFHDNVTTGFVIPNSGAVSGPSYSLLGAYPTAPGEGILLVQTNLGMNAVSLSFGWWIQDALYVGQQDSVVFVNSVGGTAAAVDRNGNTLWEQPSPFNRQQGAPFPFVSNLMLDIVGSSAIAAYNTYNGTLLTTLLIPTDCYSNASLPSPSLQTLVPDASYSNVYFSAGLPCLFRLDTTLTLYATPLSYTAMYPPIIDSDNKMAYIYSQYQIFSVSIPVGMTKRRVFSTSSQIVSVIPSSTLSSPQNLGQGLNPLVYVVTSEGLTAINVLDVGNTYVWNVAMPNILQYTFYNNSVYVVTIAQGICRISLNIGLNSSQRLLWCVQANRFTQDSVVSNIDVSVDGIVFVVVDSNLVTIDSNTHASRWHLGGTVPLADTACPQIIYDPTYSLLFVSCSASVQVLDTAHAGKVLYSMNFIVQVQMYYYSGTLFVGQNNQDLGVSGFAIPTMYLNRGDTPVPAVTQPPAVETPGPNFYPIPAIPPPLPSFPAGSEYAEAPSVKSIQAGGGFNSVGSTVMNTNLFPEGIFLTPHIDVVTGACVVAQLDAGSIAPIWMTNVSMTPCLCTGTSLSVVVGPGMGSGVFAFVCSGDMFAYDGYTGQQLWNTTNTPHQFQNLNGWVLPTSSQVNPVILAVTTRYVLGYDSRSGKALFINLLNVTDGIVSQVYQPLGGNVAYMTIVGSGVQVIQLGPNQNQSSTTLLVQGGANSLCQAGQPVQYAVPAEPNTQTNVFINTNMSYFACYLSTQSPGATSVALFEISLVTATIRSITNVTLTTTSELQNLMVERPAGLNGPTMLYLVMSTHVYLFNAAKNTVWVTSGSFNPTMVVTDTLLLVAGVPTQGSGNMPLYAFNKGNGYDAWNVSIATPYTFLPGQERFGLAIQNHGMIIVGGVGVYGINETTGTVVWASQTGNQGMVRSLSTFRTDQFNTATSTAGSQLVWMVAATFYSTTQVMAQLTIVPDNVLIEPRNFPMKLFDAYIDPTSQVMNFVAVDPSGMEVTNFAKLLKPANQVVGLFSRSISVATASAPITFVFSAYYVELYHTVAGTALPRFYYSDFCGMASGTPLQTPVNFVVQGNVALFTDLVCVYRINVVTRSMSAVLLSPTAQLNQGAGFTITSDNSTALLCSTRGAVFAVNIASMTLAWSNDANQFFVLSSLQGLVYPPYDPSTPLNSQQIIGYSSEGVVSLDIGTGAILWYNSFPGLYKIITTSDGALIVATEMKLTKLSLVVNSQNRVLWQNALPTTYTGTTVCLTQIFNSNVIVLVTSAVIGVDLTTGFALWVNTEISFYSCSAIYSIPAPYNPNDYGAPLALIVSINNQYVITTMNGTFAYYFQSAANKAKILSNQLALDMITDVNYSPVFFPSTLWNPPLSIIASPPTVPAGYTFNVPVPTATVVQPPISVPPQALTIWTTSFPITVMHVTVSLSVVVDVQGRDTLFQLVSATQLSPRQLVDLIITVDATTGNVVNTMSISSGSPCGAAWMGLVSQHILGLYCPGVSNQLQLFDVSTITPTSMMNLTTVVPKGETANPNAPLSLMLPLYHLACFLVSNGTSVTCIHVDRTRMATFGTVAYTVSCAQGSAMPDIPFYHENLELLVTNCVATSSGSSVFTAYVANSGNVSWSNSFVTQPIRQVYLSQANYGAYLFNSNGNASVHLFAMSSGASIGTLMQPLPTTPPNAILAMYVVEVSVFPVSVQLILVTGTEIVAFNSATNTQSWNLFIGGSPYVPAAVGINPLNLTQTVVFVVPVTGSIQCVDAVTGGIVFSLLYTGPSSDVFQTMQMINNGQGVLVTYLYSIVYVDAVSQCATYYPVGGNSKIATSGVLLSYTATGNDVLLNIPLGAGGFIQIATNVTGAVGLDLDQYTYISSYSSRGAAEYIVGKQGAATLLYDGSGNFLWGAQLPSTVQMSSNTFDPAVFVVPSGRMLVQSVASRTFVGYSVADGTLQYMGYLPLCNGAGTGQQGSAVASSIADPVSNLLYINVQNPCVYAVNATTGAVSQVVGASGAPLQKSMIITAHCLIVMDTFGTLMCYPRGAALSAATTVSWKYTIGYVTDVVDMSLKFTGNFVLVNVGNVLYCFVEASGALVWEVVLGPHMVYTMGGNNIVFARSWFGVYAVAVDPAAPQRILWSRTAQSLLGAPYTDTFGGIAATPKPVITANGAVIVTFGSVLVGLNTTNGKMTFLTTTVAPCTAVTYLGTEDPLSRVFFAQCGMVGLYSVSGGTRLAWLGPLQKQLATPPLILPLNQRVLFSLGGSSAVLMAMPSYILDAAAVIPQVPSSAPSPLTMTPGATGQGQFTPIPSLPPGATMPDLSCVLNIEALYGDMVQCVNSALNVSFQGRYPNQMSCTGLAEATAPCVANWIKNTLPNCPGSIIYLNNVLVQLNSSAVFNYCGNPTRCSDGATGAHAICELVNAAQALSAGATFAPQQVLPRPANVLPSFTIPHNTAGPTTTPGPSTTRGPTTAPTPTSGPSTTAGPSTSTTTTASPTTTAAPTTPVPVGFYLFTCTLLPGQLQPPTEAAFSPLVGQVIGLSGPASISITTPALSSSMKRFKSSVPAQGAAFSFIFVGENAEAYSTDLNILVVNNATLVAQNLGVGSITAAPYTQTPSPQGASSPGMSGGAVAGIVIVVLAVVAGLVFVGYRQFAKRRSGRYVTGHLRGSMIQEEGYGAAPGDSPNAGAAEMNSLVNANRKESVPIYSSL